MAARKTAKTEKPPKASATKPADPTEEEAEAEADETAEDLANASETGGTNPEPASEESKQAAIEAKAAQGDDEVNIHNMAGETDALRETAREQSEERRDAAGAPEFQPSAEYAEKEPEGAIDREDVEMDVPRPLVYSSADMKASKVPAERTATESKILDSGRQQGRKPTATEAKLARQGVIPPYR